MMDGEESRIPENVELEQALLGAILTTDNAYFAVCGFLKPEHFFEHLHQDIYRIAGEMISAGKQCTPLTIKTFLPSMVTDELNMGTYLATLAGSATLITNAVDYGRGIHQLWLMRELYSVCDDMVRTVTTPGNDTPVQKLCAELYREVSKIDGYTRDAKGSSNYQGALTRGVEAMRAELAGSDNRIEWCLPEMQAVNGYMRPLNLTGLMSDSGGGKTSLALQQCRYSAEQGFSCAFFSIEITEEEAALQAACQKLQIPMTRMDSDDLSNTEKALLEDEMKVELPFEIVGFATCGLQEIRARCMSLKRQKGLDLVIIDHAKLIELPGKSGDMFAARVNDLYRGLKTIAKEVGIAIVILIQRNDGWKKRSSPRPMEGDAYGGGGVKQNLDIWFSLYRPDVFKDHFDQLIRDTRKQEDKDKLIKMKLDSEGYAWFINHKRRRGAPGESKKVNFIGETTTFQSIYEIEPEFGAF